MVVIEYFGRLKEGDAVLLLVLASLLGIPFEYQHRGSDSNLTWRFAARRARPWMKRGGWCRVRQHRHVRRRYLRYAASSAMPTKSATTARRRMPARTSMLTVYLFDQCDAGLACAREKLRPLARPRQMRP